MRRTDKRKALRRDAKGVILPAHIGRAFESELAQLLEMIEEQRRLSQPSTAWHFKSRYLLDEYTSKYLDPTKVPPDQRARAAIDKWLAVEETNRTTNIRLMFYHDDYIGRTPVARIVAQIRSKIRKVLGTIPDDWFSQGNHTNGASTRVRRSPTAATDKFVGEAHLTASSLETWVQYCDDSQLNNQDIVEVDGSVMFTVDKKSDIDRVACKEPEVNMLLQRCVGSQIRHRLRRHGINLNDQTVNQNLAAGALEKGLATVDLSSASDSITHSLVQLLLPWEWYSLMDDLRVKRTYIKRGDEELCHELEMFSSMGNGFTFELESLLFYAITRVAMDNSGISGALSVYGDDIIAPSRVVPRLKRYLAYFGFEVNAKKTHWTGLFRESCGKHYYNGSDVSPFYVRAPVRKMTELIKTLNQLLIWDSSFGSFLTEEVAVFHKKWAQHVPTILHGGPDPERTDCLVTGDKPRSYIAEPFITKKYVDEEKTVTHIRVPLQTDGLGHLMAWFVKKEILIGSFPPSAVCRTLRELESSQVRTVMWRDLTVEITQWKTASPRIRRLPSWVLPCSDRPYLLLEGCDQQQLIPSQDQS